MPAAPVRDMRTIDFDYHLPADLIAQYPPEVRSAGRLLCLGSGSDSGSDPVSDVIHKKITDLPALLRDGDLLVMNNTRVFPARLNGKKATGGRVELLVERIVGVDTALCLCKASKAPKVNTSIILDSGHTAVVSDRQDDLFKICFEVGEPLPGYLQQHGSLPLPPYIERPVDTSDAERYQTVYATDTGAVAAPTAGLHFDDELLQRCRSANIDVAFVTLHVGAGTFQPVRGDDLQTHHMHAEWLSVSQQVCDQIKQTKNNGGRVIAIGTTVVRALETAASSGQLNPFEGDTRLFIRPGDDFNVIDGLLTNFHLPRSTLLMLVCAFGGMQRVLDGYQTAVAEQYRFFSYGDAMLLWPDKNSGAVNAV